MKEEFEKNGYYVLRGVLTEAEVNQLAMPIRAAFTRGDYDTFYRGPAYPAAGVHSMGPRVLEDHPEIADVSLAHPKIIEAIEELFGEPATLAQYWSIMRPPGAGLADKPFVNGSGAHYDYKPWRCVGSYVKWMFAVIPFIDYTETAGPLTVSPGSHLKSTLMPSDGRVHPVEAAQVPKASDIELIDPSLKKGDVVLMNGFLWHEPRPNYGNSDRCGLYMKFHAKSSPPACGPTIYPTAVYEHLSDKAKHLVPYHRGDGRFASIEREPVDCIEEGQVLIEDQDEKVLVLGNEADGWHLPRFDAKEDATAMILDACNVMGSIFKGAEEELGLKLSWLSWLIDLAGPAAAENAGEWRCRVYGHRIKTNAPTLKLSDSEYAWMSTDQLKEAVKDNKLTDGADIIKWLHMWQNEEDEDGQPVTRSFGVPSTHVAYFKYNGNGNPEGTYLVGEFDENGLPMPVES